MVEFGREMSSKTSHKSPKYAEYGSFEYLLFLFFAFVWFYLFICLFFCVFLVLVTAYQLLRTYFKLFIDIFTGSDSKTLLRLRQRLTVIDCSPTVT